MLDIFGALRGLVKLDSVSIDNNVFRLHYKVTVIILVAFSLLVTKTQFFGDPIDCIQQDSTPRDVIDTYCWLHSTFTLPENFDDDDDSVSHPGLGTFRPGATKVFHSYYQWVCFVLFLQAVMFYVPRYLWKIWEGERVRTLIMGLNVPVVEDEIFQKKKDLLVRYLRTHMGQNSLYLLQYATCEVLNFINVVSQMFIVDRFLGGVFMSYGTAVITFEQSNPEKRNDPMTRIFPRVAKCTFRKFGSSGDVQKYDSLCLLPLNIINEKIYIILWFWFVVLSVITGLNLLYRMGLLLWFKGRMYLLHSRARLVELRVWESVLRSAGLGDWFLIYLLSKNMEAFHFNSVMMDLASKIEEDYYQKKSQNGEPVQEIALPLIHRDKNSMFT